VRARAEAEGCIGFLAKPFDGRAGEAAGRGGRYCLNAPPLLQCEVVPPRLAVE